MNHFHRFNTLGHLARGRVPGQLVIQITDRCNARCPQCGMRVSNAMARHRLSLDQVNAMLEAAAAQGVKVVSFTGGEPFLVFDDLVAMIRHAGSLGMNFIRTGTNGFWLARPKAPGFYDRVSRIADQLAASETLRVDGKTKCPAPFLIAATGRWFSSA